MKNFYFYNKTQKAYSLVEVMVSLAVIAVIISILFNTLLVTLRVSYKNFARSLVREELSQISAFIARDIRNADKINVCSLTDCEIVRDGILVKWSLCSGEKVCRQESFDGINYTNVYETPNIVKVTFLNFESGFGENENLAQKNIIFTIVADHVNNNLSISNVTRQQSVSTRNYTR
jgi:prepilin-type N-terminal cleavage/methylation domain-containing protein